MPSMRVALAPVRRDQLDVSLSTTPISLESLIHRYGAIHTIGSPVIDHRVIAANVVIADAAIIFLGSDQMRVPFRADFAAKNAYTLETYTGAYTADFYIYKVSAGTTTKLGYEAVDLTTVIYAFAASALGSTLKAFRDNLATAKITVTDTTYTSGNWGVGGSNSYTGAPPNFPHYAVLRSPLSLVPRPAAYFEVPITGSGTPEDPFQAQMPEEIIEDPKLGRRNLLALSHSAFIPTDSSGKPIHGTAIVRIFDQPDRDPRLRPIQDSINALRAIRGVGRLTREAAIALAKRMDDKLHDVDLLPARGLRRPVKDLAREYIEWREYTLGVKRGLIDDRLMESYVLEEKW